MKTYARSSILLTILVSATLATIAKADPPPITDLSAIFCLRITDIEEGVGTTSLTFEVLNWTDTPAFGLNMAMADPVLGGSGGVVGAGNPFISDISIKEAGRGPIGFEAFDSSGETAEGLGGGFGVHHSGRGRDDISGHLNDWNVGSSSATSANWSGVGETAIPNRDLVGAYNSGGGNNLAAAQALVPGFGFDQLFDSAVDGGPGPYFNGVAGEAGPPVPDGSGNVLDGFVLEITDFDFGEVLALNWFLLDAAGNPLGTASGGNTFGFGVLNLTNFGGELGEGDADPFPVDPLGPVFVGNTGFDQNEELFVFDALDASGFQVQAELGGGITAPFMNEADNVFGAPINTQVIPEPGRALLLLVGVLGCTLRRRR